MTTRPLKYVSDELTHFVGKDEPNDDARYELVLKILGDGFLSRRPEMDVGISDRGDRLSSNKRMTFDQVCFCDVPFEALETHARKYGRFGLAFPKRFAAEGGASPVRYVPRQARGELPTHPMLMATLKDPQATTAPVDKSVTLADAFDESLDEYEGLYGLGRIGGRIRSEREARGESSALDDEFFRHHTLSSFVQKQLFGFLKFYDLGLPDDHPENHYLEREWRIAGDLTFREADISRVIVPQGYAERVRTDRPAIADRLLSVP